MLFLWWKGSEWVCFYIGLFTSTARYLLDWWDLLSSEAFRLKTKKMLGKIIARKEV